MLEQSLRNMGFMWNGTPLHDSVVRFQTAYCGPPVGANTKGWLDVDGIVGPATNAALDWAVAHNRLSTNFSPSELWCKHCGKNFVRRELLSALEELRHAQGDTPLSLLSVCRCPEHNKAIGGKHDSQHQYGSGADPKTVVQVATVERTGRFSGIGSRDGFKSACHIDVRHIFGPDLNTTHSTVNHPAKFRE